MKKVLLCTLILLGMMFSASAQTITFEETFESLTEPSLPAGWSSASTDPTAINLPWMGGDMPFSNALGFSGKTATIISSTTSDVLLISPEIALPAGSNYSLSFLIGRIEGQPDPLNNHYAVYVLPATSAFVNTAAPSLEEDISVTNVAIAKNVDLSAFAGQTVKIYFRQFNSSVSVSMLMLDTIRITRQQVLATSEVISDNQLGIYPNPASDYVFLKSKSKITKAEVFDIVGRKMNTGFNENRVDVRNLKSGAYMLKVTSENKTYSQKIIKK
ncbi:T9SS-dependent choice-of-anchor J family protein [Chryseobacterium sp. PMSZPI]|uniref:T9SS-dependent choice-of-anchor J family protein n=1 Tax=Chryseobacterium sp. PMSZPI TaxID=1033900 RepID=UPI001056085C|nr:T9SS type A sorting domain-containing protein [Chryseobacterium sp. PMSZPI]